MGTLLRRSSQSARIWPTEGQFRDSFPEDDLPELRSRRSLGICFSGGGTRSASCSLGQMRALYRLGCQGNVRYVSAISGGAWLAVPYTYLPRNISDGHFLGPYLAPQECSVANLSAWKNRPARDRFTHVLARSEMVGTAAKRWGRNVLASIATVLRKNTPVDETWGEILWKTFLEPLGIGNRSQRYMTWTTAVRDRVMQRNPSLRAGDFQVVEKGAERPFLIVGGVVMDLRWWNTPKRLARTPPFYFCEFTPLYAGVSNLHKAGLKNIGGGYVEPVAFDTKPPPGRLAPRNVEVAPRRAFNRLSIQDVMATSGAAPAYHAAEVGGIASVAGKIIPGLGTVAAAVKSMTRIFPKYSSWPVRPGRNVAAAEYRFGDGGFLDNFGLIPMLKRDVGDILVFINTNVPLARIGDVLTVDDVFPQYFGIDLKPKRQLGAPAVWRSGRCQVFREADWAPTIESLLRAARGGGAVYAQRRYVTVANAFLGVPAGRRVRVTWFYNAKVRAWENALPSDAQVMVDHDPGFKNFPYYKTFLAGDSVLEGNQGLFKKLEPVDLSYEQVALLANLSAWSVLEAARDPGVRDALGL